MKSLSHSVCLFALLFLQTSCGNSSKPQNRGAIVFGDSSTIVTESDLRLLRNNVTDIVPQNQSTETDTAQALPAKPVDTAKAIVAEEAVSRDAPDVSTTEAIEGLQAPFSSFNLYIKGIKARAGKKVNWQSAPGASFTLEEGSLASKLIAVEKGTITKVTQRVQTVVMLKTTNGKMFKLTGLPSDQSAWVALQAKNGQFNIKGLNNKELKYDKKFTANALKNAVQKVARAQKWSKKEEQKVLQAIRTVRSANQAPCSIALQSVVWKISGKDANGKSLEKELRIDINL
jgi:hypothetical protein